MHCQCFGVHGGPGLDRGKGSRASVEVDIAAITAEEKEDSDCSSSCHIMPKVAQFVVQY